MDWYVYISWMLIITQVMFILLAFRNFHYALAKHAKKRRSYQPRTALIIPCKNLDTNFEQNISGFYKQDYQDYLLLFVVGESDDPAYEKLCELKEKLSRESKAKEVRILVAGPGQTCSQKTHNLLFAYRRIASDTEVLAFADSDICVKPTWLGHLVHRLQFEQNGATSGYRWFVPRTNNPATLALVALNAKVAQLLGNTRRNQAWGGSMAIKVQTFRELGIEAIWQKALSDDLSLSYAVKSVRKKVEFVPGCIVASYESTTWPKLFEFGRRQFLITRISAGGTWWFGLLSCLYSIFGLWGGAALVYAAVNNDSHILLFVSVPVLFFFGQLSRAILRQLAARKVLERDWPNLKVSAVVDIFLFWLWSPLMLVLILSSAFGRTIRWRGIRYKLLGPTETVVLGP